MDTFGTICTECGEFYGTSICLTCAAPGASVTSVASLTSSSNVVLVDNRSAFEGR